jgi:hypothetical protein
MIQIPNATNRGDEQTKGAGKCGQIYGGPMRNAAVFDVSLITAVTI